MLASPPQIQMNAILDFIYPIGSYFITESSNLNTVEKVQNHFGGTWTRVEGRFLYGSSSAGSTGGSNDAIIVSHSHTFKGTESTTSDDGSHNHDLCSTDSWSYDVVGAGNNSEQGGVGMVKQDDGKEKFYSTDYRGNRLVSSADDHSHTLTPAGTITTTGSSATNANMPAYRSVFMYRRTG